MVTNVQALSALAKSRLERSVIVEFEIVVGVYGLRTVAVVWIWHGSAGLARRLSHEGKAVNDDCGMVVFQLVLIGPRPIGLTLRNGLIGSRCSA